MSRAGDHTQKYGLAEDDTMSTQPTFTRATRRAVKLKLAVQGPSGSGKTLGALALAKALAQGGQTALIDTENGSASLYADRYAFDVLELRPPYTSERYLQAIKAAAEAGYAVVVVDSLSHQWVGEGGILARKEVEDARPGANSYTNWAKFTKEHEAFKAGILNAPVHIVVTLRAKQDYVLETNDKGKQQPRKVGMAPVQREGMEYEFTTVWELQMDHRAAASKDRTGLYEGQLVDLVGDRTVAQRLIEWLDTAAPAVVEAALPAAVENDGIPTSDTPWPGDDGMKGKTIKEMPERALTWLAFPGRKLGEHTDVWQQLARDQLKERTNGKVVHA